MKINRDYSLVMRTGNAAYKRILTVKKRKVNGRPAWIVSNANKTKIKFLDV